MSQLFSPRRLIVALSVGTACLFAGANRANAGNMLLQIEQGGVIKDFSGTSNMVSASGVQVGDYMISFSSATSNTPGNGFNAILNSVNLTITRMNNMTDGTDLIIRVLADDFTLPDGNPLYVKSEVGSSTTGLGNQFLEFVSFFSPTNSNMFGDGVGLPSLIQVNGVGEEETLISTSRPNPAFALSQVMRINIDTIGSTMNSDGSTEVRANPFGPGIVPEPASMALLAVGGLGLVGFGYRRRKGMSKND